MVYVDTSVLLPLFISEPHGVAARKWCGYAREKGKLVVVVWCIPEFASALGIKQRADALDVQQAQGAWTHFERMVAADLRLLRVVPANFHRAAELVPNAASALRAGYAIHQACAESAGAKHMATLSPMTAGRMTRAPSCVCSGCQTNPAGTVTALRQCALSLGTAVARGWHPEQTKLLMFMMVRVFSPRRAFLNSSTFCSDYAVGGPFSSMTLPSGSAM
jgi:predicted nucleic acid-binding protein